jgi:hypothetical protein
MISAGMLLRFLSLPTAMALFILAAQAAGGLVMRTTTPTPVQIVSIQ